MEYDAIKKAHDILRALLYDPAHADEYGTDERKPRFLGTLAASAMHNALKILKIFGIAYNKYAYVEKVDVVTKPVYVEKVVSKPPPVYYPPYVPPPTLPPKGCNCTQSNYEPCRGGEGVCSSAAECQGMGGEPVGKCANCLGCSVCCKYVAGCQGMTDKMITYFQSPAYPRTDRSNEVCSLTLNVRDEVCQVKLDFIDFEMAAPLCGNCDLVDNLEIINTAQPGGVLGPGQSRLCGLNSGQHLYVPVKPNNVLILKATTSGVLNVPLAATDGRNRGLSGDTAFRWNVRVTQIPCRAQEDAGHGDAKTGSVDVTLGDASVSVSGAVGFEGRNGACRCKIPKHYKKLRAPWGCRQYFEDNRGKLKSFNFDGDSEVSTGLDYAICVRRTNDACGMTLNALTFSLPASPYCLSGEESIDCYGGLDREVDPDRWTVCCTGSTEAKLPGTNYFGFDGLGDGTAMRTMRGEAYDPNQNRYFYCGEKFGNGSIVVGRTKGPLIMRVVTSENYWGQCGGQHDHPRYRRSQPYPGLDYPLPPPLPEAYCPPEGCQGFLINYDVNKGSC